MKYFDTFTGYGGFTKGIQQAYEKRENSGLVGNRDKDNSLSGGQETLNGSGVGNQQAERPSDGTLESTPTCIGYSEVNKYAISVYQKHFPEKNELVERTTTSLSRGSIAESESGRWVGEYADGCVREEIKTHKNYGDITQINAADLPDFDLLTGGFPCQAFSIAGKRLGFDDTRGTLFFDVARILREKKPRWVVLENVKGLLSHDNGRTFKTIISTLVELGYGVEWQVLNAKNHGVPQNRERVFIVGNLGGERTGQVFPLGSSDEISVESDGQGDDLAHTLQAGGDKHRGSYVIKSTVVAPNGKLIELEDRDKPYQLLEVRTEQGKKTRSEIRKLEGRDSTKRGKDDKKYIPKNDDRANALTTGAAVIEKWTIEPGMKIRRLTPTECERLMGLPDGWTARGKEKEKEVEISDSQRYKLCGNGVVVNVVEAVISKILSLKDK